MGFHIYFFHRVCFSISPTPQEPWNHPENSLEPAIEWIYLSSVTKRRFRPSKRIVALQTAILRHLHLIVLGCYLVAECITSPIVFHLAPFSAVCAWYQSALVYTVQHLMATVAVWLLVALVGWVIGNPAAWEQLRRSREPYRVLAWSGVAGLAADTVGSLLIRLYSAGDTPGFWVAHNFMEWIAIRLAIWAVAFALVGCVTLGLLQPGKRRPMIDPLPKGPLPKFRV